MVSSSDKDVLLVTKKVGEEFYLITVNVNPEEKSVVLDIAGLDIQGASVEVLFEDRNLEMAGRGIQDGYRGYERHVYRFR